MLTKRGKARLILIFSTNTNCENMAYRSFRSEKCSARGVRKVTTGITSLGIGKSILKLKEFRTRLTLPWPTLLLSFARLHPQSSFVFEWPKWQTRFALHIISMYLALCFVAHSSDVTIFARLPLALC